MNKIFLTIAFSIIGIVSFSQSKSDFSIEGKLVDSTTNQAIIFTNIAVLKASDTTFVSGTTTDDKGNFRFNKITIDSIFVRVSSIGYETKFFKLILSKKDTNLGAIMILPETKTLEEVSITSKKPIYQYQADKKVYNISEDAAMQNGTTSDALQNAPGVWVDMEGNITLRGVSNVSIWINGKPSKLNADGLKSYLQQLPANALDKIEVMTNPSAKYGASGNGGIINIITKEKIKKNFLLSAGLNASTQPSYSPWLYYIWSNEKWSISSYISNWQSRYDRERTSNSIVKNGDDTLYSYESINSMKYNGSWSYGNIGVEYEISKNNSIDFYFGGGFSTGKGEAKSYMNRFVNAEDTNYIYSRNSSSESDGSNWNLGSSFVHKFNKEDHKLTMDLSIGNWQNSWSEVKSEVYQTQAWKNKQFLSKSENKNGWNNLNVNYENPFNDTLNIEAGFGLSYNPEISNSPTDTLNPISNLWENVKLYSNKNNGSEFQTDGYFTFSNKIWGVSYKLGIRGEYISYNFRSDALNMDLNRDFFGLYPSIYLSYATKNQHNFSLNYARRVRYPSYELDPFIDYVDVESLSGGNIDLKKAYTNSFEAGWAKYFTSGGSINISLYQRNTMKSITDITYTRFDTIINRTTLFSTYTNSGNDNFTGCEFTFNLRPKKYINIMLTSNLYNKEIKADLGNYKVDKNLFSYDSRATLMLTIKKNYTLQFMGYYRSESSTITGSSEPIYYINTTLKADLFKQLLSIRVSVQDIFNWQKQYNNTNTPNLITTNSTKTTTQYVSAGITLRFGKIELESKSKMPQAPSGGAPK